MGDRRYFFIMCAIIALAFSSIACGRTAGTPATPDGVMFENFDLISRSDMAFNTESGFGIFDVIIDPEIPSASLVPLRHASAIGDSSDLEIDQYLKSDPCADCLVISNIGFDEDQRLIMDVGIRHPFDESNGRPDLDVFDVRAIMVVDGHTQFTQTTVDDEPLVGNFDFLENADGYTTHYDDGPDGEYSGNINPYINFFTEDNPSWDGTGVNIPNRRMAVGSDFDYKRMFLNIDPGEVCEFRMVIEASYGQSAQRSVQAGDPGSRSNPTYFIPEFNRKEVYSMNVDTGTIDFDGTSPKLIFDITALDWQGGAHVAQGLNDPGDIIAPSGVEFASLEIPELGYFSTEPDYINGLGIPEEPINIRFSAPINRFSVFTYLAGIKDERDETSEDLNLASYQQGKIDTFLKMGANVPITNIHMTEHEVVLGRKSVAVDGNRVYVVWCDVLDMQGKVYCARSMDGGQTFLTPQLVNDIDHEDSKQRPSVDVDDHGVVYVVWEDYENLNPFSDVADIMIASSNNYGYSFGQDKLVNDYEDVSSDGQSEPTVCAVGDGTVYVCWMEQPSGTAYKHLRVARSANRGVTFTETAASTEQLRTGTPTLAANSSGTVWVAWRDYRNSNQDIFASMSSNGGQNFGCEIKVNDDAGLAFQSEPSLAINSDGTAYLAWLDNREGGYNIYFARSSGTTAFTQNQKINRINYTALTPVIAATPDGGVFVAYRDTRNDAQGDIYVTASLNGGGSFTVHHDVLVNDDTGPSIQRYPQIAVSDTGKVHLVWGDGRELQPRIFYANSIYP